MGTTLRGLELCSKWQHALLGYMHYVHIECITQKADGDVLETKDDKKKRN